jgi:hypothetical protein
MPCRPEKVGLNVYRKKYSRGPSPPTLPGSALMIDFTMWTPRYRG